MKKVYLFTIALLLIGGIVGNLFRFSVRQPNRMPNFSVIPIELNGYMGQERNLDETSGEVLKADITTLRDYSASDQTYRGLFIAYFKSQKYGSQIHSPKHCLPGGGWKIDVIQAFPMRLPDGSIREINHLVISNPNFRSVMFYWYETRSGIIRSEYGLKLDLIKNALFLRPTDAAIVRITVDAPDRNIEKATKQGIHFIETIYPHLKKSLSF
ncbi:MAG: EpsI family protein [candidate division Zixibacteria bacterium]|nr:EpsI family protein [candidate division Zixibacteria bacterium]